MKETRGVSVFLHRFSDNAGNTGREFADMVLFYQRNECFFGVKPWPEKRFFIPQAVQVFYHTR